MHERTRAQSQSPIPGNSTVYYTSKKHVKPLCASLKPATGNRPTSMYYKSNNAPYLLGHRFKILCPDLGKTQTWSPRVARPRKSSGPETNAKTE